MLSHAFSKISFMESGEEALAENMQWDVESLDEQNCIGGVSYASFSFLPLTVSSYLNECKLLLLNYTTLNVSTQIKICCSTQSLFNVFLKTWHYILGQWRSPEKIIFYFIKLKICIRITVSKGISCGQCIHWLNQDH